MNRETILEHLYAIIIRKNPNFKDHDLSALKNKSLDHLGMDSLGMLNFMVAIEDELGIEWDEDRTNSETLKSLESIAAYIEGEFANVN